MNIKYGLKRSYRALLRKIPDRLAIHIDYLRGYKRFCNLKNPKTFGEKIQWVKLHGNLERYSRFVDKCEVREYINEKIGHKYLPKLYGVYINADDISFDELPNKFVLKCNHGCGYNIICSDKSKLNIQETKSKLNKWLKEEFYKDAKEIQYKNIDPRIICEEYLEDKSGALIDYKYFCFNGVPKFIQVIKDRCNNIRSNFYDLQWNSIKLRTKLKNSQEKDEKPIALEEMNKIARKLSEDFPFVRVDFYNVNGRIIFGELTFTPGGGVSKFRPFEKDLEFGSLINLECYKR